MKFLCVPCNTPMKLIETRPPDRGSISLVYSCPECAYEFAMLTNPYETQIVGSLGVQVGPQQGASPETQGQAQAGESKCPFGSMVQAMTGEQSAPAPTPAAPGAVPWTAAAEQRLETVPEFVRPMARTGIERFAAEKGYERVDERVLDEAREFFGM